MLVLSRKQNDSIVIPDLGVTIRVLATGRGRIRLGIEAPREVPIQRLETFPEVRGYEVQSLSGEHLVGA
jgi:carbon storage regulator